MNDGNGNQGNMDAGDGQDVCSFFASIINQRQSIERLLNWLRESQTTCTDSICSDDLTNGETPSIEGSLFNTEAFSLFLCFVVGMLTLYAANLNRNMDHIVPIKDGRLSSNRRDGDDHNGFRRNNDSDGDPNSPAL